MIYEIIRADIIKSMKEKAKFVTDTLRGLDSEIQKKALDTNKSISDDLVLDVIAKAIKQRNESIEVYTTGKRMDLVQKEMAERDIIKHYQPEQLTTEELEKIIDEEIEDAIDVEGAPVEGKIVGLIMKSVMQKTKGKADSKVVSDLVKSKLGIK